MYDVMGLVMLIHDAGIQNFNILFKMLASPRT